MTNRFEYTAPDGHYLRATDREESGVWVVTSELGCLIELARLEEVVAGLRDMAGHADGQAPEPHDEALCGHCGTPRASHHHPWTSTADAIADAPQNPGAAP